MERCVSPARISIERFRFLASPRKGMLFKSSHGALTFRVFRVFPNIFPIVSWNASLSDEMRLFVSISSVSLVGASTSG